MALSSLLPHTPGVRASPVRGPNKEWGVSTRDLRPASSRPAPRFSSTRPSPSGEARDCARPPSLAALSQKLPTILRAGGTAEKDPSHHSGSWVLSPATEKRIMRSVTSPCTNASSATSTAWAPKLTDLQTWRNSAASVRREGAPIAGTTSASRPAPPRPAGLPACVRGHMLRLPSLPSIWRSLLPEVAPSHAGLLPPPVTSNSAPTTALPPPPGAGRAAVSLQ